MPERRFSRTRNVSLQTHPESLDGLNALTRSARDLGILGEPEIQRNTKGRRAISYVPENPGITVEVVDDHGFLRLREAAEGTAARQRRMRGRTPISMLAPDEGDVIGHVPLSALPDDDVRSMISALDRRLTPLQGLYRYDGNGLRDLGQAKPRGKRFLLIIHGTFSHGMNVLEPLRDTAPGGRDLLNKFTDDYDDILVFNHPTLSVDAFLNACVLANRLKDVDAEFDVITHSRGGLVTRWWAEVLDRGKARPGRIVFAGSPLAGTGLAAAPNLRKTINTLANISKGLAWGSAAVPFLNVAVGLFHALSGVLRQAASLPLMDAAVGLVPGLRAMSRVGNNSELKELRDVIKTVPTSYFVIRSNFEPEGAAFAFWKRLRGQSSGKSLGTSVKERAKDLAADAIFDGENDLVVDTDSMTSFFDKCVFPKSRLLDFGTSKDVHHTNYFEQKRTVEFLTRVLGR